MEGFGASKCPPRLLGKARYILIRYSSFDYVEEYIVVVIVLIFVKNNETIQRGQLLGKIQPLLDVLQKKNFNFILPWRRHRNRQNFGTVEGTSYV